MDLGHDLSQAMMHGVDFLGELSFCRRRYTRDLTGADIAVLGIPFDGGTVNRPGARFGPRAIREQTSLVGCYPWANYPWTVNPFEQCEVIDYSDVAFTTAYPDRMVIAVEETVSTILDADVAVLSMGGDHMVAYPLLKAHAAHHGPLALVHFDAHSDTWGMGDDLNHGTWGHLAVRHGLLDVDHSIQIGMRTPNPDDHGLTIIEANELLANPMQHTVDRIRAIVGERPTYVTFDIDFLDPAYAPGTGTPVCGGPTTQQARELLVGLAGCNIIGADVVEVSPPYDPAGVTALAGATIAYDLLALMALNRSNARSTS